MPQRATASSAPPRAISIPFSAPSNEKYGVLVIPQWARRFFREGYKVDFDLRTPRHQTRAHLTSAKKGTRRGDEAGNYLVGGLQHVFAAHPSWQPGMWANFERRDGHVSLTVTDRPRFYHQS